MSELSSKTQETTNKIHCASCQEVIYTTPKSSPTQVENDGDAVHINSKNYHYLCFLNTQPLTK